MLAQGSNMTLLARVSVAGTHGEGLCRSSRGYASTTMDLFVTSMLGCAVMGVLDTQRCGHG